MLKTILFSFSRYFQLFYRHMGIYGKLYQRTIEPIHLLIQNNASCLFITYCCPKSRHRYLRYELRDLVWRRVCPTSASNNAMNLSITSVPSFSRLILIKLGILCTTFSLGFSPLGGDDCRTISVNRWT
jgi:hypothetical protein